MTSRMARSGRSARPIRSARSASNSPAAHALARAGLTARGVIYILIGWLAILLAVGKSSQQANQQGALQLVAKQPFGLGLLWLLGIGFAAYALWRLSEAAFGVTVDGKGAGPRLKSLIRAIIYASFAATTFSVIQGTNTKSQAGKESDLTATVMRHAWGQWLVGIVGVVIAIVGLVLISEGWRRKFEKYLRMGEMSSKTRRIVVRLGMVGSIARGVVLAVVGVLVVDAAVTYQPSKAGGLSTALSTLRKQPFGEFILIVVAIGLIIFGIYGLCEARWRKV
jgi:Domain of Unknown Function (DUF1206)